MLMIPTPTSTTTDQQAIFTQQQILISVQAQAIRDLETMLGVGPVVPGTPATGTGTAGVSPNGNQLTVSAVTGVIVNESVVTDGALVPTNTIILGQISGTPGGAGVYLTSNPTSANATPLTFTPPPTEPGGNPPTTNLQQIIDTQAGLIRLQVAYLDNLLTLQALNP